MLTPVSTEHLPVRRLFDTPIHALNMREVIDLARQCIAHRRRLLIGVVNAAKLVNMTKNSLLRESVLSSDIVLADGMSVVWACKLLRRPLAGRIAGINLMHELLGLGNQLGLRVYGLGATQEVAELVAKRIGQDYRGVQLVGYRNGYFSEADEPGIVAAIRDARPDILFVAMSPPKKEAFLARWIDELDVPVCHGVGGSFDVLAGKVKRAPRFMQRIGMEWLYRMLQEPRRLAYRYLVTNTLFCWMLLRELVSRGKVQEA